MNTAPGQHHYNPDWLSDDALVANFIARMAEFTFLRGELARAPLQGDAQHYLLVGLRGAGKTTLLKRLAVAIRTDADLQDHLIALSFPEELYQVKNLADFWWASCEALADELDHLDLGQQADQLIDRIEQIRTHQPATDAGLKLLQQTCAELERRPVLLVDNLDLVFRRMEKTGRKLKDPHAAAYWELREALSTSSSPIVIGCSVRLSEPFIEYDTAFYDFFIPKHLGKLSLKEVQRVLNHLADTQHVPEVKQRLQEHPARIESLFELTGGNLRALGLIFELLRQGPNSRAVEDFERLMDITTPYYKARFEDLSDQAQVVMHALAVRRNSTTLRFGHTAAEIGAHAGLPTGSVSAQLDIMTREGLVEKSAAHGRTQYRITEQLFRLWLQMRSTRRVRQNVIGLTEFLEAMFDRDEIHAQMGDADGASPLSEAKFALAVAGTNHATPLRQGLEAHGADRIMAHLNKQGGKLDDYIAPGDLPEALAGIVELRERLRRCDGGGLSTGEQEALLGSLR
ncbi:MAG: AAA family ATPase, partial [Gammaproteobacteria bacterium]|nr:AAA family ATPase [Gammaproteobacteria bacterium]